MTTWLGYLAAFAVLLVLAPLVAWLGHKHGRSVKGGLALASIMLGFGVPIDPPAKHLIEATEEKAKEGAESGDPPDPDVARPKSSGG